MFTGSVIINLCILSGLDATCGIKPQVRCLNEAVASSCQRVFKPWEKRLDANGPALMSDDDDPELLLHVPFDGSVKLKAICIIGGEEGRSPSKLKVCKHQNELVRT